MAKVLTVAAVEKIKPADKRLEIPDGGLPGLYLIVQPTGRKSWAARYRLGKRTQKLTIGTYPLFGLVEARQAAQAALRAVAVGGDPGQQRRLAKVEAARSDDLFPTIARQYVEKFQKPRTRTWLENARTLGLRPASAEKADDVSTFVVIPGSAADLWSKRRIGSITKREIAAFVDGEALRAPIGANRALSIIKTMFKWAVQRDIIEANPAADVSAPSPQKSRDRVLTDDELFAVWRAAEKIGWPFGSWLKLAILTGQRKSEVAGIRRSEIDERKATWTIPGPRAKNGKAHLVPLSRQSLAALSECTPATSGEGFILTTTGDTPIAGFSKAKHQIDALMLDELRALAEQRGDDPSQVALAPWRLHDLRRTMATRMPALGVTLEVVEKILNHTGGSFGGVVAVYQRYAYDAEKREALQRWADYVEKLVSAAPPARVVKLAWVQK